MEGCGGLRSRKMGPKLDENATKMGRNTRSSQSHFPHFSGGRRSSPQFPLHKSAHRTHRRKNGMFCRSPSLTAPPAGADAWHRRGGVGISSSKGPPRPAPSAFCMASHSGNVGILALVKLDRIGANRRFEFRVRQRGRVLRSSIATACRGIGHACPGAPSPALCRTGPLPGPLSTHPTPGAPAHPPPPPCVTFRRVAVSLRGPGQSPVLPFACCVGSLRSVGRCGRCSCRCRFRVRGAQSLVCRGCAGCGGMCRLRVSGTNDPRCSCPHTLSPPPTHTCPLSHASRLPHALPPTACGLPHTHTPAPPNISTA